MQIANVKIGFVTNSSSAHCIITGVTCFEGMSSLGLYYSDYEGTDPGVSYGRGDFCLIGAWEKIRYIRAAILCDYRERDPGLRWPELYGLVMAAMPPLDKEPPPYCEPGDEIDHQSQPRFPRPFLPGATMQPLWDYLRTQIVLPKNVVILGGDDNREPNPFRNRGTFMSSFWDAPKSTFKVDPSQGFFTFFRPNGLRVRFMPPDGGLPKYGDLPDLVDLKITDKCERGCPHCYQDSKPDGKECKDGGLWSLFDTLQKMGVFEIAIGGGEPLACPSFYGYLIQAKHKGIIPNVATGNWRILEKDVFLRETILKDCGGIAFSTNDAEQAIEWTRFWDEHRQVWQNTHPESRYDAHLAEPSVHYILGLNPPEHLHQFLDTLAQKCFEPPRVVLLAWKDTGRAGKAPYPRDGWWDILKTEGRSLQRDGSFRLWRGDIAVDTMLVPEVREHLKEIPPVLYEESDGRFSFYIDAVRMLAAPHSAWPVEKMVPIKNWNDLPEVWREVRKMAQEKA